ncbi:MAG: hypothetical protein HPY60_11335, partial [Candidatus Methanofastidiosum sp.]|nr:hypothetical protein [Methanofastidiosum sp.]
MPMSANIFNVDLLEDFEANVLLEQLNETEEAGTALRTCHVCGSPINDVDSYECPFCGVIIKTAPKRKERAERTLLKTVESENKNGTYSIYRLQDGTFYCNCLSFLRQRGVKEESYGLTCKHIRNELPNLGFNLNSVSAEPVPVTSWQKVMLKKLGVVPHEKLSREQAYWIIRDSLDLIGVDYRDFISLVRENSTYELLPVRAYGVELEGLVRNRMELFNRMREEGYRVKLCGYNHEIDNNLWKVGDDGSVRRSMTDDERSNYESVELTSPKLFGDVGFRKISKALEIWNSIGSHVNNSCGFHVHIDLYDYDSDDLARLMLVWMKIEPIIYFLVSLSRRNNGFTIFMRRQYGDVLARLFWGSKNN